VMPPVHMPKRRACVARATCTQAHPARHIAHARVHSTKQQQTGTRALGSWRAPAHAQHARARPPAARGATHNGDLVCTRPRRPVPPPPKKKDDLRGARLHSSGEEAYVKAKTYLLMSGRELARRLEGSGVDVIAGALIGGGGGDGRGLHASSLRQRLGAWLRSLHGILPRAPSWHACHHMMHAPHAPTLAQCTRASPTPPGTSRASQRATTTGLRGSYTACAASRRGCGWASLPRLARSP
jgi:hypothetical protein